MKSRKVRRAANQKPTHGFAGLDPQRIREIARAGGRTSHAKGTAHEWTSEEARRAGKKGGEVVSRDRAHMAELGRKGAAAKKNYAATFGPPKLGEGRRSGEPEPAPELPRRHDPDLSLEASEGLGYKVFVMERSNGTVYMFNGSGSIVELGESVSHASAAILQIIASKTVPNRNGLAIQSWDGGASIRVHAFDFATTRICEIVGVAGLDTLESLQERAFGLLESLRERA